LSLKLQLTVKPLRRYPGLTKEMIAHEIEVITNFVSAQKTRA